MHGHDWEVTATFAGETLDACGFVVDFVLAEQSLGSLAAGLHHTDLNTNPLLGGKLPTAEIVARVIYDVLAADATLGRFVARVCVKEAPGCRATYAGRASV
jgi:6-pyruvoyltetrahydropterin/6-carboxytetrahydropterin synthase